jgi:hypothetical protein
MNDNTVIRYIQESLTDELRNPEFRGNPNPMAGYCYVASEAFYYLRGGRDSGFHPAVVHHEGGTHWFLREPDGHALDITVTQYTTMPDHPRGRNASFRNKKPSKRAAVVIRRVAKLMAERQGWPVDGVLRMARVVP